MTTTHKLKSWTPFFKAIKKGEKMHDLRVDDRNYKIGDILILEEYDPFLGEYSGNTCKVVVTYITSDKTPCAFSSAVLQKGYCILSLRLLDEK